MPHRFHRLKPSPPSLQEQAARQIIEEAARRASDIVGTREAADMLWQVAEEMVAP